MVALWMRSFRVLTSYSYGRNLLIISSSSVRTCAFPNCFHCGPKHHYPVKQQNALQNTRWDRLKSFMHWHTSEIYKMKAAAVYIYESCTDSVDVEAFFTRLKLPDTFLSWFLVVELHVWMCLTRIMAEQDQRKALFLRNEIVSNLWNDTQVRIGKLALMATHLKKEGMKDLSEHFQAAITIYDEGLQGSDKDLAGALWRIILGCQAGDPRDLETLVHYVRNQVHRLDRMTFEEVTSEGAVTWPPLLDFLPRVMQ